MHFIHISLIAFGVVMTLTGCSKECEDQNGGLTEKQLKFSEIQDETIKLELRAIRIDEKYPSYGDEYTPGMSECASPDNVRTDVSSQKIAATVNICFLRLDIESYDGEVSPGEVLEVTTQSVLSGETFAIDVRDNSALSGVIWIEGRHFSYSEIFYNQGKLIELKSLGAHNSELYNACRNALTESDL